jgi:hypothetical protein
MRALVTLHFRQAGLCAARGGDASIRLRLESAPSADSTPMMSASTRRSSMPHVQAARGLHGEDVGWQCPRLAALATCVAVLLQSFYGCYPGT